MIRLLGLWSVIVLCLVGSSTWAAESQRPVVSGRGSQTVLPVTKIVLYASGVGYFQRDGRIEGRSEIVLRFEADHINDLLKSMTVQDFDGGQVTTVTYDARDPLSKTLKSFAIDLTANPGIGALLQQIRGEPLEVATPGSVRGTILGVEKKREKVGERDMVEVEYLNLLTDNGFRAIPLGQIQRITLVNARLDAELRQALEVLAASHDTQKKTVRLVFDGTGVRQVRVGYIAEMPMWKTTYRLVLSDTVSPYLQGWAIVENTTDEDWENVQLSLVSGHPISFVMDLYEPLYVERPVVIPELYSSLRPRVYEQALGVAQEELEKVQQRGRKKADKDVRQRAMARARALETAAPSPEEQQARIELQQGVTSVAQAADLGELFEYGIKTPVTLGRHTSAMLPIVSEDIKGTKLSVYNERVHAKHPLNGLRFLNSTALHLMQGPITMFDAGTYAGDARLADLPAGQEQLISYAVDLEMEVEPVATTPQQELVSVSLTKGMMLVTQKAMREKIYAIRNRAQNPKMIVVEHPIRPEWQLIAPPKAPERTREVYRFSLTVDGGKTARLSVREAKPLRQMVRLMDAGPDLVVHYIEAKEVRAAVKQALRRVVELRHRLDQTRARLRRLDERLTGISQEQSRIRQNMARLAHNSVLYNRYVRKLDQQETAIEDLTQEIDSVRATEDSQKRELQDYLLELDID